jgi:hypothetical protein
MSAPLDTILDFETNWDATLATVFATLPFPVNTAHGDSELSTPFITATFTFRGEHPVPGGAQPQQRGTTAARFDGVSFDGVVTVEIVVDRRWLNISGNPDRLAAARGGLRRLFLPSQGAFSSATSPYYGIAAVTFGPCNREVDTERDLDITSMEFGLSWFIRPEAWPS